METALTQRLDGVGLRGCDAVQILGVELAGQTHRRLVRVVRGVCEMYTDPQARQADQSWTPERLPGEGQSCAAPPGPTSPPDNCAYPLVCAKDVCASPYH